MNASVRRWATWAVLGLVGAGSWGCAARSTATLPPLPPEQASQPQPAPAPADEAASAPEAEPEPQAPPPAVD
ncbi:MAG TPA: hypothetical protein VHB21_01880, partial [Minicystis sp.]|nr:hypothetical protein [Minicystis sp.]